MTGDAMIHPYDRHVGRYGEQLAAKLIALAGVTAGDHVPRGRFAWWPWREPCVGNSQRRRGCE